MLRLNTFPSLHRPITPLRSLFSTSPSFLSFPRRNHPSAAVMASSTAIEHIVLFSVKSEASPTQINAMVTKLRSLVSLPQVSHLTTGPILRHRSSAASPYTHILHGRYPSKDDLARYSAHAAHVDVVNGFVLPVCNDVLAFDWVGDLGSGPIVISPGSAARLTLVKMKEGVGESGKGKILEVLKELKDGVTGVKVEQVSFGENFSPARAKGYEVGLLTVLPGMGELDRLDAAGEEMEKHKEKVRPLMESVIVVDFVVPPLTSARQ